MLLSLDFVRACVHWAFRSRMTMVNTLSCSRTELSNSTSNEIKRLGGATCVCVSVCADVNASFHVCVVDQRSEERL